MFVLLFPNGHKVGNSSNINDIAIEAVDQIKDDQACRRQMRFAPSTCPIQGLGEMHGLIGLMK